MRHRAELLAEYLSACAEIGRLRDVPAAELEAREGPDEWSVRQIVHHMADVEVGDAMRLRQMLAHESPLIVAYDEGLFAGRLHYERPIADSVAAMLALRASNAAILARIAESDWARCGRHEERERYTVEILAQRSIEHDRSHLDQIRRARRSAGKPHAP